MFQIKPIFIIKNYYFTIRYYYTKYILLLKKNLR